jgi:hypothetical protein
MEASRQLAESLAKPEPTRRTLWAISDELEEIAALIAENGGELTPDLESALDRLEGEFSAKVERVALFVRQAELHAEGAKAEKDRLAAIQKANEQAAAGLKRYLLGIMERHGRDKVDTPKARVRRVLSPPSYRWTGDTYEQIPDAFRRTRVVCSLDVDAVKKAIEAGEDVPAGVVIDRNHHIRVN